MKHFICLILLKYFTIVFVLLELNLFQSMSKLYYQRCAFANCKNHTGNPDVRFHMFPLNEDLFKKWVEVVDNPELVNVPHLKLRKSYSVCGEHFDVSQFQTPERKKLLRGSIPIRPGMFTYFYCCKI